MARKKFHKTFEVHRDHPLNRPAEPASLPRNRRQTAIRSRQVGASVAVM
jgi:hypothetical protein